MRKRQPRVEIPAMPHIGDMYRTHIVRHRISQARLSRLLGKTPSVVLRYRYRRSLQCFLLWELCVGLKHNFFMDLALLLPESYTYNTPSPQGSVHQRVAALEEENKLLKVRLEELRNVLKKE